jgi:putative transposase
MPNHVHLLVEVSSEPLSKFMQGLQQAYTQYFNRRHNKVGHLFQGRYHAILCDKDEYLLSLVRYIHLNPVRAKMVASRSSFVTAVMGSTVEAREPRSLIHPWC